MVLPDSSTRIHSESSTTQLSLSCPPPLIAGHLYLYPHTIEDVRAAHPAVASLISNVGPLVKAHPSIYISAYLTPDYHFLPPTPEEWTHNKFPAVAREQLKPLKDSALDLVLR